MLALTDNQKTILLDAASALPAERRMIFLERVAAMMKFRGRSDADVREVCELASVGLVQQPTDAA